jgi:hypothetical protein
MLIVRTHTPTLLQNKSFDGVRHGYPANILAYCERNLEEANNMSSPSSGYSTPSLFPKSSYPSSTEGFREQPQALIIHHQLSAILLNYPETRRSPSPDSGVQTQDINYLPRISIGQTRELVSELDKNLYDLPGAQFQDETLDALCYRFSLLSLEDSNLSERSSKKSKVSSIFFIIQV